MNKTCIIPKGCYCNNCIFWESLDCINLDERYLETGYDRHGEEIEYWNPPYNFSVCWLLALLKFDNLSEIFTDCLFNDGIKMCPFNND